MIWDVCSTGCSKKGEDPASQQSPLYVCLEFVLENV